jgi:hypothetical protein
MVSINYTVKGPQPRWLRLSSSTSRSRVRSPGMNFEAPLKKFSRCVSFVLGFCLLRVTIRLGPLQSGQL